MAGCKGVWVWFAAIFFCAATIPQMTALPLQEEEDKRMPDDQALNGIRSDFVSTEHRAKEHARGSRSTFLSILEQELHEISDTSGPRFDPYEEDEDGDYSRTDSTEGQIMESETEERFYIQPSTTYEPNPQGYKEPSMTKADQLEQGDLFEGDLKIPQELIDKVYGTGGKLHESAATVNRLWPQGIVYYEQDPDLSKEDQFVIREAMEEWEDRTCLRFVKRNDEEGFIKFTDKGDGCFSTYVGWKGEQQDIDLGANYCKKSGKLMHEIGHAVGFWHEQSRPDRNEYVKINFENIEADKHHNFDPRIADSLGVGYDYGSIMHYSEYAFSRPRCNDCPTIEVINDDAYEKQGYPTLGQRLELSTLDVKQANLLYECNKSAGLKGVLKVHIKSAHNLPNTDRKGKPDPFVHLTLVDLRKHKETKSTSVKKETTSPTWNQWLTTSAREWRFFRLEILDDDGKIDQRMSVSETFIPTEGPHHDLKYCIDVACNSYLNYNYTFEVDNCAAPYPCYNGGTCIHQIASHKCSCTAAWGGDNCEFAKGNLKVHIKSGKNLPDKDYGRDNKSDPYVRIIAVNSKGKSVRKATPKKRGTLNPVWDYSVEFDMDTWRRFKVQVWDSDGFWGGADDRMSDSQNFNVTVGVHKDEVHNTFGGGSITFDYSFQ